MSHIFISHATKDDGIVKELRHALEGSGLITWADSRELTGGDELTPKIERAIETARHFLVVVSLDALNSAWVQQEVKKALIVKEQRKADGYKVIPLMLPGIKPPVLKLLFGEEPVGVNLETKPGAIAEALPALLAALGEQLPDDPQPAQEPAAIPVAELVLKLSDAKVETFDGKTRAKATAMLIYEPADGSLAIESKRFSFTAPLGPIEADDLRWYLKEYFRWPLGVFKERADRIEASLPKWGQDLFTAALSSKAAEEAFQAWLNAADKTERRFSVMVDRDLPEGSPLEDQANANEAASLLLSLPWELLNDGRGFHGKHPVRVRRRLPNRHKQDAIKSKLPIRVLLVSPRPEDVGYIDHRISALPLVAAIEELGALVELTLLSPPTFPALVAALSGQQFDVIHFDGHGVYERKVGLGALCFEDPQDSDKHSNIDAQRLAEVIRDHRVPLVFLEACQSAQSELDPTTSVAASLLAEGVTSVVAMTHSVLVVTAQRFVTAFYRELARGARVGSAMLAGQQALHGDSFRMQVMGAGALRLQDWFVPVLYQEAQDLRLVTRLPAAQVKALQAKQRRRSFGKLLAEKERMQHEFVGRSRDLLKLERMLCGTQEDWRERYVVIRGRGGEGKTTIAVELAHWLTRTNRFDRAALVSLEQYTDARGVLDALGHQLLPEGENWSVAQFSTLKEAFQPVERALRDRRTIVVIDNVESLFVVPLSGGMSSNEAIPPESGTTNPCAEIFQLCRDLLDADAATRIVFTSREPLPEPFHHARRTAELRELDHPDAIELVAEVMKRNGLEPKHDDAGNTPQEIADLISAVGCHARALTLLARWVAVEGLSVTAKNAHEIFAELERKYPGNRENSLYASVELSLRRLPKDMQAQVRSLAVVHGGIQFGVLRKLLNNNDEAALKLGATLVEVGLGEILPYYHLRLDPALPHYLRLKLSSAELTSLTKIWADAMRELIVFLYQQKFQDAQLAALLTILETANLLALLAWATTALPPEDTIDLACNVEDLFSPLGRPKALAQATNFRKLAAQRLDRWGHAQFQHHSSNIDRMLEQGEWLAAYTAAQSLLSRHLTSPNSNYPNAAYDIAYLNWQLGRALKNGNKAEEAIQLLEKALKELQVHAAANILGAAHMISTVLTDKAECLFALGRYDGAAAIYENTLQLDEKRGDRRGAAVSKGSLGTIRLFQKRYAEALDHFFQAKQFFESLSEPNTLAIYSHQIGIVQRELGQFEQAEKSYKESLSIKVRLRNRLGEAGTLIELGNLYDQMSRLEDAILFYRQAVGIYANLSNSAYEGLAHNNLADTLVKLQRFDEARQEVLLAIECRKSLSHAAQLWKPWGLLYELEQKVNNLQAAAAAREQAIKSYLDYRRADGESQANAAPLYALVAQALQDGSPAALTEAAAQLIAQAQIDDPAWRTALLDKLQAILRGERDPALAADPALSFWDAVELQLLLEGL